MDRIVGAGSTVKHFLYKLLSLDIQQKHLRLGNDQNAGTYALLPGSQFDRFSYFPSRRRLQASQGIRVHLDPHEQRLDGSIGF